MKKKLFIVGLMATGLFISVGSAQASAIFINSAGTVALGVNDDGSLNTSVGNIVTNASATGLAYNFGSTTAPDWKDATSPGCLCEGWGVSVNGTTSGYANVSTDSGANNLTFGAIAGNVATTSLTSLPGLVVTHTISEAGDSLFRMDVVISNTTGSDLTDVKYVRVMDWDIPNTEFNEFVTIKGVGTTTLLEESGDNGFNTANPLGGYSNFDPACLDQDCIDSGPTDHGAYFRFNFGTLLGVDDLTTLDKDETKAIFSIFYGASMTEAGALAAIGSQGIELFSLGQSNGGEITGSPATYIFGFSGVGGVPVVPVPVPSSVALLVAGLIGFTAVRRRKQA